MKNKKSVKKSKKKNDLKSKKDLLGGLIIIVLLLLVLVTYVMCYDYKKNNDNKKIDIIDNSLSVINIYDDYSILKSETKDSIDNTKKIIGTYNCKYDDCEVYTNSSFDSICDEKYLIVKENNKTFIYNFKKKKIVSNLYDDIEVKLDNNNYIVKNNNLYGMINNEGLELVSTIYDEILIDSEYDEKVKVKKEDLYGILDINTGNVILEPIYDDINIDSSDKYSILEKDLWFIIDNNGNILSNGYSYTYAFNKGFIALVDNNLQILKYNKEANELLNDTLIPVYEENGYKIERNGSNININVYNGDATIKYEYNINRNSLRSK